MNEQLAEDENSEPLRHEVTIHQLRELTALQAMDDCLWDACGATVGEAYIQQGLRWLTKAVEGECSFDEARAAIKEMQT